MAYCTIDNIQALIPVQRWDASAENALPTIDQVEEWMDEVDSEIDSALAIRYVTPITGAKSLLVIGSIAARLVATRIWAVIHTGHVGDAAIPQDWADARRRLERLSDGHGDLEDADHRVPALSLAAGAPAMTMRRLREDPLQDEEMDPVFRSDEQF